MSEPLSYADWKAQKQEPLNYAEWKATQQAAKESIGAQALKNLPADIKNIGQGTIEAVSHPIETAKGLASIVRGGIQHALPDSVNEYMVEHGTTDSRPEASAFAAPFKADFGSVEGFKNAIATHPASTFLNATTLLSGLSGATRGISKAAKPAVTATGRGVGTVIGDLGTHTGGETIRDAALAGYTGGDKLQALLTFMREKAPLSDIVATAKKGQTGLAKQDSAAYTSAMNALKQDKTILPYNSIEDALNSAKNIGTYQGHVVNPAAVNVQAKLQPIIDEWSGKPYPSGKPVLDMDTGQFVQPMHPAFNPAEAHTIEGLDQLKKRVGIEYKSTQPGTPERLVAKDVYKSIKDAIADQNTAYGDVMGRTQNAIKRRNELSKELSLNENITDSTALRKLLAVPRNNANTNYGNRVALAKLLEDNGATNLMTMLNGAALSSAKPRGIGVIGSGGTAGAGLYALMSGNIPAASGLAALTAAQSPRLMGELAVRTGRGARVAENALNSSGALYDKLGLKPAIISAILQQQQQQEHQ